MEHNIATLRDPPPPTNAKSIESSLTMLAAEDCATLVHGYSSIPEPLIHTTSGSIELQAPHWNQPQALPKDGSQASHFTTAGFCWISRKSSLSPSLNRIIYRTWTDHLNSMKVAGSGNFQSQASWSSNHCCTGHCSWSDVYPDWHWGVQNRTIQRESQPAVSGEGVLGLPFSTSSVWFPGKGFVKR